MSRPNRVLATVVLVLVAGVLVEVSLPDAAVPRSAGSRTPPAAEGAWYCAAAGTAEGERSDLSLTAVPGTTRPKGGARDSGEVTAQVAIVGEGEARELGEVPLTGGRTHATHVRSAPERFGAVALWEHDPTVLARTWLVRATARADRLVHGPCVPEPSPVWYLPGISTAGGSRAHLVVANPFDTDAAFGVTLLAADGAETPVRLQNVSVAARSVRTIDLNVHAPERPDLGAIVEVRAGRAVAEAWVDVDPGIGGVDAASLVPLVPEPALRWTVPWVAGGGGTESWAWVSNPGDEHATVAVSVHGRGGGEPAEGAENVTVPAGGVRRIDLGRALPSEGAGAFTVTSENDVPITVSGAVRVPGETSERSGFVVQRGQPAGDARWVLAGIGTVDRTEAVHIVNPGATVARVSLSVTSEDGLIEPEEWQRLEIAPGGMREVDVGGVVGGVARHAVLVEARSGTVIAGLRSEATDGPLRLVAPAGVPGAVFSPPRVAPAVRFDPRLTRRIGTRFGPALDAAQDEETVGEGDVLRPPSD